MSKPVRYLINILILSVSILVLLNVYNISAYAEEDSEENTEIEPYIVVSLGDSYSSGEGVEDFYDFDLPPEERYHSVDFLAHRSVNSWPGQLQVPYLEEGKTLKDYKDVVWFFEAISGAKTKNLAKKEMVKSFHVPVENKKKLFGVSLEEIKTDPIPVELSIFDKLEKGSVRYVTVTIGGNDVGFVDVIKKAAAGVSYQDFGGLKKMLSDTMDNLTKEGGIGDDIIDAYAAIQDAAGAQAHIIVAGYPGLLSSTGVIFNPYETAIINYYVQLFDEEIEKLVKRCETEKHMQISYVSVIEQFYGHEAYSVWKQSYINPVYLSPKAQDVDQYTAISDYSLHPNKYGIEEYRRAVQDKIIGLESDRKTPEIDVGALMEEYQNKKTALISNTWIGDGGSFLTLNPDNTGVYWEPGDSRESFRAGVPVTWEIKDNRLTIPVSDVFTIYTEEYKKEAKTLTFLSDSDIWAAETFTACESASYDSGFNIREEFSLVEDNMKRNDGEAVRQKLNEISAVVGEIPIISDYRERLELFDNTYWFSWFGRGFLGNSRAFLFRLDGTFGILVPEPGYESYKYEEAIDRTNFFHPYEYKNNVLSFDLNGKYVRDGVIYETNDEYNIYNFVWDAEHGEFIDYGHEIHYPNDPNGPEPDGYDIEYYELKPDKNRMYEKYFYSPDFHNWCLGRSVNFTKPELSEEEEKRTIILDGCGFLLPEAWYEKCDLEYKDNEIKVTYKGYEVAEIYALDSRADGGEYGFTYHPYELIRRRDGKNSLRENMECEGYIAMYIKTYPYAVLWYKNYKDEYSEEDLKTLCDLVTNGNSEFKKYLGMMDDIKEEDINKYPDKLESSYEYFMRTDYIYTWFFEHSWWE